MTSAQDYLFKYSKWLIFVLAYLFLGYKLVTFDGYEALLEHFSSVSFHDYLFLFFVFLLLPFNLFFEALKWQRLVAGLQPISLGLAFRSVLVGQTGAFFTPNRIGEFPADSYRDWETDRKSTRLNSSHRSLSRMPSSA